MKHAPRLLIIGLDCAEPSLVFERWKDDLPHLTRLMQQGSYGALESCIPAITVPAWSCMTSGRDPGELGIYGFRNRADRSYQSMAVANSRAVREPRLWDMLSEAGWKVAVVSVPGTYPPTPLNGVMVSCFLTPNTTVEFTHPQSFADQIDQLFPPSSTGNTTSYMLDVPHFRSEDKQRILQDIYTLCDQRFTLAAHLLEHEQPDMLMMVEMGVDRIHHALWKQMDLRHPAYEPDAPLANAIHDYYRHVDQRIGELLAWCDDETVVLVVSDHGARPLMGGFCVNEWLIAEGYLVLHETPREPVPLDEAQVDWNRTKAWGAGGYYGRIFLNVQGREPEGVIAPADFHQERAALAERLEAIVGPDGQSLGNRAFLPQQIYGRVRGIAPDLVVYFSDLAWRSVGTVGGGALYTRENDTGPDDANHAQDGLLILYDPQRPGHGQRITDAQIYDILPTLLNRFGVVAPPKLRGKVLDV
ncbi:MAG: phosphodiesterase [Chloroflexi bacterium AL-W]|nr:phosphodiesterase [Chloroflexi bacterium AL-N1]NOK68355.1 phosphodiesterase [Chloroflexi bacterium AL-N10]NOK74001.1 phosphodiesterase [Chloroflexi bacterium AL-N5]NOK82969.1 phosphodiesterase [Chloroflexi bacterium AL-W]NOK90491.1 phosphodiesterase [Chloroflexi bacterium AL-N15]